MAASAPPSAASAPPSALCCCGPRVDGATTKSAKPGAPPSGRRHLTTWSLAALLFVAVAGGPYGIDAAVGAGGALPAILGIFISGLVWSLPQALVGAEMATRFPSDGGSTTWVLRVLGPVAGFLNVANGLAGAVLGQATFAVAASDYVESLNPALPTAALAAVRAAVVVGALALNATASSGALTWLAIALAVALQLPLVAVFGAAGAAGRPFDWSALGGVSPCAGANFGVFVSALCWCNMGWLGAGNYVSEVLSPATTLPAGSVLAVLLVVANYILPVVVGVALSPQTDAWKAGYFTAIARDAVGPWGGYLVTVAGILSNFITLQVQMSMAARSLRFAALYRILPLAGLGATAKTAAEEDGGEEGEGAPAPLPALLFLALLVTVAAISAPFEVIVCLTMLFSCVSIAFEFAAFIAVRCRAAAGNGNGAGDQAPLLEAGGAAGGAAPAAAEEGARGAKDEDATATAEFRLKTATLNAEGRGRDHRRPGAQQGGAGHRDDDVENGDDGNEEDTAQRTREPLLASAASPSPSLVDALDRRGDEGADSEGLFVVPGGQPVAWFLALLLFAINLVVLGAAGATKEWPYLVALVVANAVFAALGALWATCLYDKSLVRRVDLREKAL